MSENNVITFDEMLKRAIAYFKSNNIELEHILVDEFQDVGNLEYRFVNALKAKNYYFAEMIIRAFMALKELTRLFSYLVQRIRNLRYIS